MSLYEDTDLLTTDELLHLPPVAWLLADLIPEEGFCAIYGAPSSGKSFVALDWACCISEGQAWLGRYAVKQAPVIYVAAEGGRGIKKRVEAWMAHYSVSTLPAAYWLLSPLYIREEGRVEEFLHMLELRDIWPGLIVLDTLSRSFGGGEENASADMGDFVDKMTLLAKGRRMAALVIHHKNATGQRERGSTAFRGSMDAMFDCTATKEDTRIVRVELRTDKQKDDVEADAVYLRPEPVGTSIVLVETDAPEKAECGSGEPTPMRVIDMKSYLGGHGEGLTFTEWMLGCQVPKKTFARRLKKLLEDGDVYREEGRYYRMPATLDIAFQAESSDDD
jgi:hypothetical protein